METTDSVFPPAREVLETTCEKMVGNQTTVILLLLAWNIFSSRQLVTIQWIYLISHGAYKGTDKHLALIDRTMA